MTVSSNRSTNANTNATVSKFEQYRIDHNIRPSEIYTLSPLAPRTIDLVRRESNTTISTARSLARTVSDVLTARARYDNPNADAVEVLVGDLFDLTVPDESERPPARRRKPVVPVAPASLVPPKKTAAKKPATKRVTKRAAAKSAPQPKSKPKPKPKSRKKS